MAERLRETDSGWYWSKAMARRVDFILNEKEPLEGFNREMVPSYTVR